MRKRSTSFMRWETAGWKGSEGSAINCDKVARSFYAFDCGEATSGGYFRLHALEVNGRMTASAFSVVTDDCFFPMKITYDESLRRSGPGLLLLNGIMQECAENGVGELFFGGGKDYYKTSWTSERCRTSMALCLTRTFAHSCPFKCGRRPSRVWENIGGGCLKSGEGQRATASPAVHERRRTKLTHRQARYHFLRPAPQRFRTLKGKSPCE